MVSVGLAVMAGQLRSTNEDSWNHPVPNQTLLFPTLPTTPTTPTTQP